MSNTELKLISVAMEGLMRAGEERTRPKGKANTCWVCWLPLDPSRPIVGFLIAANGVCCRWCDEGVTRGD